MTTGSKKVTSHRTNFSLTIWFVAFWIHFLSPPSHSFFFNWSTRPWQVPAELTIEYDNFTQTHQGQISVERRLLPPVATVIVYPLAIAGTFLSYGAIEQTTSLVSPTIDCLAAAIGTCLGMGTQRILRNQYSRLVFETQANARLDDESTLIHDSDTPVRRIVLPDHPSLRFLHRRGSYLNHRLIYPFRRLWRRQTPRHPARVHLTITESGQLNSVDLYYGSENDSATRIPLFERRGQGPSPNRDCGFDEF